MIPKSRPPEKARARNSSPIASLVKVIRYPILILLAGASLLSPVCLAQGDDAPLFTPKGPLESRNQYPIYLLFYNFTPTTAQTLPPHHFQLETGFALSNVFLHQANSPDYDVRMDLEVFRPFLQLRYGITERIEVGAEIPFIHLSEGVLDGFISWLHNLLGSEGGHRAVAGNYKFNYSFKHNGANWLSPKRGTFGLGDIALTSKFKLFSSDSYLADLSARVALKIPSGKPQLSLGSGNWDFAFGLCFDYGLHERWVAYLNLGGVIVGQPDTQADISVHNYFTGMLALEFLATEKLSLIAQLNHNTSLFTTGIRRVDQAGMQILGGIKYAFSPRFGIQFDMVEELITYVAPDVTFNFLLNYRF